MKICKLEEKAWKAFQKFHGDGRCYRNYYPRINNLWFVETKSGCHICVSHKPGSEGYAVIQINKKKIGAHRFVYELNYGPIPLGFVIMHKCDNPLCINPLHLVSGSHADNQKDKVTKNRQAKGEKHGRSILTVEDVKRIKVDSTSTNRAIARQYGVDQSSISKIRRGLNWTWVKPLKPTVSIAK